MRAIDLADLATVTGGSTTRGPIPGLMPLPKGCIPDSGVPGLPTTPSPTFPAPSSPLDVLGGMAGGTAGGLDGGK